MFHESGVLPTVSQVLLRLLILCSNFGLMFAAHTDDKVDGPQLSILLHLEVTWDPMSPGPSNSLAYMSQLPGAGISAATHSEAEKHLERLAWAERIERAICLPERKHRGALVRLPSNS